ncbi:MAG TPA: hypothetical protein DC009_03980 [Porphyromonadaceae bacterium]|nr:hypothetical protein [Porphyromonadaceae bacterium]
MKMRLEDAMVYALAAAGRGMTSEQLAETINRDRLHVRADGKPVTGRQVYAAVCRNSTVFVKEGGRILLAM